MGSMKEREGGEHPKKWIFSLNLLIEDFNKRTRGLNGRGFLCEKGLLLFPTPKNFPPISNGRLYSDDPSAGSPTETLLRLLLPLETEV